MYEEYKRGYHRDDEYYERDYPREEVYKRGYPREEDYNRGYHHDDEYEYRFRKEDEDRYLEEDSRYSKKDEYRYQNEDDDTYSKEDEYRYPKEEENKNLKENKNNYAENNQCTCNFPKDLTVGLREQVLCATRSVVGEAFSGTSLEVDIPPNAAITKINASILQTLGSPIDSGFLRIFTLPLETTTSLFAQDFNKSPDDRAVAYETSFTQPLCVGPGGARANVISLYRNVTAAAAALRITVVYCPNYCNQPL